MILVTGGTGLVGAHLLHKLISNGDSVRAIYRNKHNIKKTEQVFSVYGNEHKALLNKIEWVKADLLDIPALTKACENITEVYHVAAFVSFEPDKYHRLRQINIEGTANIVNICLEKKVKKICYVSSIATLGVSQKNEMINEESHWNPENDNSVYGITKYGGEMEVWRSAQEGLDVVIINPGVILGGGIWKYGSGRLFKMVHKGINFYTSGSIGVIAVEDVVDIMLKLMKSEVTNKRFVLISENWSYKELLNHIAKSLNRRPPQKKASRLLLEILWRLDWLSHKVLGTRRKFTRHLVTNLQSKRSYSNLKIQSYINHTFRPIDQTIAHLGNLYLKQVQ